MCIATGAVVPPEDDAIVPIEDVLEADDLVGLTKRVRQGAHIRGAGEDIEVGDKVIPTRIALGAGELALLAALGHGRLLVRNRPKVAVLVTGDELVLPPQKRERDRSTTRTRSPCGAGA